MTRSQTPASPLQNVAKAFLVLALGTLLALPAFSQAVLTDDSSVVADGDFVRIDAPGEEVDVDWRSGNVHVRDADDDVLVSLGAVRAADHILVPLAGDVLFEFGSAALDAAAEATLYKVAQAIRQHALGEVVIVGHTDSVGSTQANQQLSEERALSVVHWLHQNAGIPAHILLARGMGELRPVAPNTRHGQDDPTGRARNRRVEVVLGTTPTADVRALADTVRITEDAVEVAGVRVTEDSVEIGALAGLGGLGSLVSTGATPSGSGDDTTCPAGKTCRENCSDGDCDMTCSSGAICFYDCSGGGCNMACSSGANCTFTCNGGDCRFEKAVASRCQTSCTGGGCRG